ncbi:hypothetical protein C8R43DRAFT_251596 [Mycena crocata]|nr:hypothetical protein C8R43DRAFT_251596 [Mycena crocata]
MNPAFTYDGAFPQRSSSRRPPPPPNFRVDPRLVWQNGGAETTNQTRLVAPMEWRSWERESAAEAALNPTFVPDLRLRHPPPPSAEYLSTRLSDNPLGLLNMVPREELFGPMSDEGHGIPAATPWISNPRGLDDMVTTQHVALGENQEAIHTQVPALLRPPARTAYLAEPLSDNPLGLMNMVPREELYGTRDEPAPTPWMWNPRGLSEDISTTGPDVGEHNDILRSPVAPPGHLQFGRHDAGYALGYINGLLSSWENRVNLRSIVMISDAAPRGVPSSGALHNNLEVIEGQIDTSLTQILKSRGARQAARQLGEIKMQSLIDAIQDVSFLFPFFETVRE